LIFYQGCDNVLSSDKTVDKTNITAKRRITVKEKCKKWLQEIFIDGLSGMALGLFSTLIIGTIIAQIGSLVGGSVGA
jgi:hypothetical protein